MSGLATKQENQLQHSVWSDNLDVAVMEKLINNIIHITGDKNKASNEELTEQPWFDESSENVEAHLEDDDDEILLASIAL